MDDTGSGGSQSEWRVKELLEASSPRLVPASNRSNTDGDVDVIEIEAAAAAVAASADDPGEYAVMLRKKLALYCAAVANSRGPSTTTTTSQESSLINSNSLASEASQSGCQVSVRGHGQNGGQSNYYMQSTGAVRNSANSISSKDITDDDDDDIQGETMTKENTDPVDTKRMKRMLSNRESARRSRRRKQVHLSDLESQASQLKVENALLIKRLDDITQKYHEVLTVNGILRVDLETVKAKVFCGGRVVSFFLLVNSSSFVPVKMAREDSLKSTGSGITQFNPANTGISMMGTALSSCLSDTGIAHQEDDMSHLIQSLSYDEAANCPVPITPTSSLPRVASLESLQKRVSTGRSPSGGAA